MVRKRTIDRRRRCKGVPPKPKPPVNESDDSSIDHPHPKTTASVQDCGSFDKNVCSPKQTVSPVQNEESGPSKNKRPYNDSAYDELDNEKESAAVTSARKKKSIRSTAPKRKRLKLGKKSQPPKTNRAKMKKAPSGDSESGEDSNSGNDTSASEFEPDSEGEESSDSDASWGSDDGFKKKKGRAKQPARAWRRSRLGRVNTDEAEASWKSDEVHQDETVFKTPVRGRRSTPRQALVNTPSDNEENESPRKSTPSRRAASRALDRIHILEIDENDDDDHVVLVSSRKKKIDEDEEFDPAADDTSKEECGDDDLEDESPLSSVVDEEESDDAGNVDEVQDFLTADSSSDELVATPSPMLDIKFTRLRRRAGLEEPSSDSSDDELQQQLRNSSPSLHVLVCPSQIDAVTMDRLPDKHICYFTPDQQTRHCFAIKTLHKIALCSSIRKDGKPTFLQPPHFRAPASDDIIDQIASRFGRAALDLGGDFYSHGKGNRSDDNAFLDNVHANLYDDDDDFQHRLNEYYRRFMGSQDIYCCPLCYMESHRRLANLMSGIEEDSDEEIETENSIIELWHDPMTVLGFPDNDRYNIASMFCFTKITDVKQHLREAHNVDTKVLDTNDLFPRFKIRTGDGLLQRYLEKNFRGHTYQGDMRRYWNLGNNKVFIFLLDLMKHQAGDAERAATEDFYRSFEDRVKQMWDTVSAPYRKATKGELQDFIASDEDVEEDAEPHFVFQRDEVDPEKEILESLKRRRMDRAYHVEDLSDDNKDDDKDDDAPLKDTDSEVSGMPGYYSEVEEEEDDWVKNRLPKKRRGAKVSPTIAVKSTQVTGKRLGIDHRKGGLKRDTSVSPIFVKKSKRNHHVLVDSDSD